MRLSDIIKKKQPVRPTNGKEPAPPSVASPPKRETPAESKRVIDTAAPASVSAIPDIKKIYGEAIDGIRSVFSNIKEKKDIFFPDYLRTVTDVVKTHPDEILMYCAKTTPDSYIYSHSVNVCIYAVMIARTLGYSDSDIEKLAVCAFLHDVGMIELLALVSKRAKLSASEFEEVKMHPALGQDYVNARAKLPAETKNVLSKVILQIHERVGGGGYPKGLKSGDIHDFAKIIAVCDTYEAMTHPRSYKEAEIPHNAIKNLINLTEDNFDTDIMKAFINTVSLYPVGSYVRLSNNEIAKVVKINKSMPTRPKVKVIIDPYGKKIAEQQSIDLVDVSIIAIKESVDETKLKIEPKLAIELQSQRWWLQGI